MYCHLRGTVEDSVEGIGVVACNCKNSNSEPAAGQVVAAEDAEVAERREVAGQAAAR